MRRWLKLLVLPLPLVATAALPEFQLVEQVENLLEGGQITRSCFRCQGREISFQRPAGWTVSLNPAERQATFQARRYGLTVVLRLVFKPGPAQPAKEVARLAEERFPAAQMLERFPCYANNVAGAAMDLREPAAQGPVLFHRLAVVSFEGGQAEFSLTTAATEATRARAEFDGFLSTFAIEPVTDPLAAAAPAGPSPAGAPQGLVQR